MDYTLTYEMRNNITKNSNQEERKLEHYANIVDSTVFSKCLKYPAYYLQDIKNILQYYTVYDERPVFIELKDREQYDIDKIAAEIREKDLGEMSQAEFINKIWESEEVAWQTFFNLDKLNFLREIQLAKIRLSHPELFFVTTT